MVSFARNWKIGYKVVGSGKTSFRPATDLALQRIRYRIGQTTYQDSAEFGPFAVFARLRDAARWAEKWGEKVCLIEYQEAAGETCLWKKNPPTFTRNRWGKGYHAESAGVTEKPLDDCPRGTVLASAVTVLQVVEL